LRQQWHADTSAPAEVVETNLMIEQTEEMLADMSHA
jgi:hypothetical protein